MKRFENKNVMITGAASGIGRAAAIRIASEGGSLALIDLDSEKLSEISHELTSQGVRVVSAVCDVSDFDEVTFTSDLQASQTISLLSFDTTADRGCPEGFTAVLQSVLVEYTFSGSADIAVDNDDDFQGTTANARIIRTWSATGPGVNQVGTKTLASAPVELAEDDGDDDVFDSSPPDGHAFTALSFSGEDGGSDTPGKSLYETAGPGTVDFEVAPVNMVNDLQFDPTSPDQYQTDVQNPEMKVRIDVTYSYECIPEPSTFVLAAVGLLALGLFGWRRR